MDQTLKEKPKIKIKLKPHTTNCHTTEDPTKNETSKTSKGTVKLKSKEGKTTFTNLERNRHVPFFSPKKKPNFTTVKTSLKSVLSNYKDDQPRINGLVIECHQIVTRTYQFMRLYLLNRYANVKKQMENNTLIKPPYSLFPPIVKDNGSLSTEINKELIRYFIRAGGIKDNRGRKPLNQSFIRELDEFYLKEYQPHLKKEKYNLKNKTDLIDSLAIQIQTGYNNNLKVHFITRIRRLMNLLNPMDDEEEDGGEKEEKKRKEKERKKLFGKIKNAILVDCHEEIPEKYQEWSHRFREDYLPPDCIKCYGYDVKVHPEKYIYYSIKMNEKIEQMNATSDSSNFSIGEKRNQRHRLFQPIPLRTSIIPCYIQLDATSINSYFLDETGRAERRKNLDILRPYIWESMFSTDHRVMKKKGYIFKSIRTDGIGVSICFQREDYHGKDDESLEIETSEIYIDDLSEEEIIHCRKKKLVGSDPGKEDLTHMMDDQRRRLRYGSVQRQVESQSKRNREVLLIEKQKNHITEEERMLIDVPCKTVDYSKFQKYITLKTCLDEKIGWFYQQELYRKMKWRSWIDRRKSEDLFLERVKKTYGSPDEIVVCHGNWSQHRQMKYLHPTLGIGMRRLLGRRYKVLLVDEWGTSKYCNQCHHELIHHHSSETGNDLYRVVCCPECQSSSSESKKSYFFNRDANACMNILYLCHEWLDYLRRPIPYSRKRDDTIIESDHLNVPNGKP